MAEHTQITFFTTDVWNEFGNMETEMSRLKFTLSRYPERGLPSACERTVQALLCKERLLKHFPNVVGDLKSQSHQAMRQALGEMTAQHPSQTARADKEAFLTFPVDYKTSARTVEFQVGLWTRVLEEIAECLASGNIDFVEPFLQVHSFLKDPIGGLKAPFQPQVTHFNKLLAGFGKATVDDHLCLENWKAVAAQLAAESSFLALPKLQKVVYVHFSHHQELPYVYVSLDKLPRAEFSVPTRVLELAVEMVMDSTKDQLCHVAPITVAYRAPLESDQKPFKVIIDGNNRATALALLRFLATQDLDKLDDTTLDGYCRKHNFGSKWLVDIKDVVAELCSGNDCLGVLKARRDVIGEFAKVTRMPALIVQEQSFHTICMSRLSGPRPVLLQPMHQTLYNSDSLCLAWAAQHGQAHGRPLGYKMLPLI